MQAVCKRHTELPHTSKLFSDLLYRFDRVEGFYPHAPLDAGALEKVARGMDFPAERRAALVEALRTQNPDSASLRLLSEPGTVAVLTGQQVGLYGGPAYTVYKALTAVRLARLLTDRGIPAVPVFWVATEDHDLAEVSSCWSFDSSQKPILLRTPHAEGSDKPVGGLALGELPHEAFRKSLAGFPFGDEVTELAERCYRDGVSFGEAFVALVRELLGKYDLLFFDPMHAASRQLAAPFLRKAVEAAPELTAKLLERNRQLNDAGYHAQVHVEKETSLFFLLEDGRRLSLRRRDGTYHHRDRQWSAEELAERAASLSPNATLRPVVQDYMFPTVAYIGGPAELAYLAQSEVIYETLLGRMPVAMPRNCFTLIDERSGKLMKRYDLRLDALFPGEDTFRETLAARLSPPEVNAAITEASHATKAQMEHLLGVVGSFDATLGSALEKSTAKIQYQIAKMQRKVARESLRRDLRAQEEAHYLFHALYPHKHLQERFYGILPFLARHGMDLVDRIYEHVHVDCPDHHLLFL
ncbi:MAG: bacillithiol biosynthesis cysteine-adding enzyme BshC [Acidobacteria bacterium]|nr:bacillithiol biosynthesis cysteine-adding enzyme BshC [Acidobacteriota bacterium]